MFNRLKTILAVIISPLLLASCDDLRDDYEDCGVWLQFIFDHNMDNTDTFSQNVDKVDVLVFDESGKLYSLHQSTTAELSGSKRLFIGGTDMPKGKYTIVTVGGLTDHFVFSQHNGGGFAPGLTTLDQVRIALKYNTEVAHEFPHLWFSPATVIDYKADLSIWPIRLVRQTNKFNVALEHNTGGSTRAETETSRYTIEITTPESGAYGHTNAPLLSDPLVHHPYSLSSGVTPTENGETHYVVGDLNTMRLFENHGEGYTLTIRDTESGEVVWDHDLIDLLSMTGERRLPDGTPISLQEYLDRQGEWNLIIVHNSPPPPPSGDPTQGFIALQIRVNGWIVWTSGVGI